jgi:hypothetical protein
MKLAAYLFFYSFYKLGSFVIHSTSSENPAEYRVNLPALITSAEHYGWWSMQILITKPTLKTLHREGWITRESLGSCVWNPTSLGSIQYTLLQEKQFYGIPYQKQNIMYDLDVLSPRYFKRLADFMGSLQAWTSFVEVTYSPSIRMNDESQKPTRIVGSESELDVKWSYQKKTAHQCKKHLHVENWSTNWMKAWQFLLWDPWTLVVEEGRFGTDNI